MGEGLGGEGLSGITLDNIAAFLDARFDVAAYANDTNGVYVPSERGIARLGLALEPWPELAAWCNDMRLDGLFLHRPWRLSEHAPTLLPPPVTLSSGDEPPVTNHEPPNTNHEPRATNHEINEPSEPSDLNVGGLAYHLPFDEHLTLGYNPRLADALRMRGLQVLGEKEGRALGMIGDIAPAAFPDVADTLRAIFGGCDEANGGRAQADIGRVAVVGAMTDALVREAGERGAQLYVTGQFRVPARLAVQETGMATVVVGHERSERWGLRALAGLLRERWDTLEILLAP